MRGVVAWGHVPPYFEGAVMAKVEVCTPVPQTALHAPKGP